jgi:nucleotide-binding universal stress UspA family protein
VLRTGLLPWRVTISSNDLVGSAVKEARTRLANERISVSGQVLVTDTAVDELVHYVERTDVHLLIMSSAGHGGLDRVLTGSTVSGVVGRVSCATLVVPYRTLAK